MLTFLALAVLEHLEGTKGSTACEYFVAQLGLVVALFGLLIGIV